MMTHFLSSTFYLLLWISFFAAVTSEDYSPVDYSPATGVFTCSVGGSGALLNYRASQGGCRVVIHGFSQNVADSKGNVRLSSSFPNATISLSCQGDPETAIRVDEYCTCQPINSMGEGCTQGLFQMPTEDEATPPIASEWPNAQEWKTIYAPASGVFICSAVEGDVCTLNPQATRACYSAVDGFLYELKPNPSYGLTLTSTVPNATLMIWCIDDNLLDPKSAVQCDSSCICMPNNGTETDGHECNEWSSSTTNKLMVSSIMMVAVVLGWLINSGVG